jgi:hypothetical protein
MYRSKWKPYENQHYHSIINVKMTHFLFLGISNTCFTIPYLQSTAGVRTHSDVGYAQRKKLLTKLDQKSHQCLLVFLGKSNSQSTQQTREEPSPSSTSSVDNAPSKSMEDSPHLETKLLVKTEPAKIKATRRTMKQWRLTQPTSWPDYTLA